MCLIREDPMKTAVHKDASVSKVRGSDGRMITTCCSSSVIPFLFQSFLSSTGSHVPFLPFSER